MDEKLNDDLQGGMGFQLQPKQEWSEEDERKLELLKALIEDAKGDATSYSTMFREIRELNNWLETIKNRVIQQPKKELTICDHEKDSELDFSTDN